MSYAIKGSTLHAYLQNTITKTSNDAFEDVKNEAATPEVLGRFEEKVNARIRKFVNDHLLESENFAKLVEGREPAITVRVVNHTLTITANEDLQYLNEELKKDI